MSDRQTEGQTTNPGGARPAGGGAGRCGLAERIDVSVLAPEAVGDAVDAACAEAYENGFRAVCVLPGHVSRAHRWLKRTGVRLSTVIDFPFGTSSSLTKLFAAHEAAAKGAEELGVVVSTGTLLSGDWSAVVREVGAIVNSVGERVAVSAIVEADAMPADTLKKAAELLERAGVRRMQPASGLLGRGRPEDVRAVRAATSAAVRITAAGLIDDWTAANEMFQAGADQLLTAAGVRLLHEWEGAGGPAVEQPGPLGGSGLGG